MPEAVTLRIAEASDADAIRALTREAYAKWVPVTGREPTVPDGDALLIVNVAVATTMQGRGFGTRLLRHAEELAASSGLRRTRLYTNKLFAENLRLYRALGYRFDREEPLNSGVSIHMSKIIVPR